MHNSFLAYIVNESITENESMNQSLHQETEQITLPSDEIKLDIYTKRKGQTGILKLGRHIHLSA